MELFCFAFVLVLLVAVGLVKQARTNSAYLFADRNTGFLALTATLVMTEFNTGTLIAFSSMGYAVGLWALALPFVFLVGLLFYAFSVAKKWKEFDGTSVADFFTKRYGSMVGNWAKWMLTLAMIGFSATYVKSLTLLFSQLFSLNSWFLSALLLIPIILMTLRGGLLSIIRTDLFSFFLVLLFFPFLALWMGRGGVPQKLHLELLPPSFVLSLTVLTMFTYILAPWYGQKIFAAKTTKVAFWSVFVAALLVFFLYASAIVATAALRGQGIACDPQSAFATILSDCLPPGCAGFGYGLLFAASATTLTGVWNALTSLWQSQTRQRSVYLSMLFALVSFLLANTLIDQVFDKMILANIPVAALAFPLLAGFYWKRVSTRAAIGSMITGAASGLLSYLFFGERYTLYWAFAGIPLSFVCGALLTTLGDERQGRGIKVKGLP